MIRKWLFRSQLSRKRTFQKHLFQKRSFLILRTAAILLVAGCAYGILLHYTGIGLVCPVRFVTGLKCPGCGVTHMCLALMRLDFAAAFMANPALFLSAPLLMIIFIPYLAGYIRTGSRQMSSWQNTVLWICITFLVLYGIVRNVFSLP